MRGFGRAGPIENTKQGKRGIKPRTSASFHDSLELLVSATVLIEPLIASNGSRGVHWHTKNTKTCRGVVSNRVYTSESESESPPVSSLTAGNLKKRRYIIINSLKCTFHLSIGPPYSLSSLKRRNIAITQTVFSDALVPMVNGTVHVYQENLRAL